MLNAEVLGCWRKKGARTFLSAAFNITGIRQEDISDFKREAIFNQYHPPSRVSQADRDATKEGLA